MDSKCSGSADMLFVLREKLKLFLQRGIFSDALLISNAGFYRSMRSFKGVIICYALLISSGVFFLPFQEITQGGSYLLRPSNRSAMLVDGKRSEML